MMATASKRSHFLGMSATKTLRKILVHVMLILGGIIFLTPFFFMVTTSLKPIEQIQAVPIRWWPNPIRWQNYVDAFTVQPMGRYFFNSTLVTSLCVVGAIFSCTLAGWGFSRPYYWGRDFLFFLLLSVMMIPGQVTMIPTYLLFSHIGWINTHRPLIVPAYFGNAFYVFMVRQFFLTLPRELNEAAVIDGCTEFGTFWRIGIPLIKPAVVTVAVFTFMSVWNDFFTPLLYLNSRELFTVALGLTAYQGEGFTHWDYMMAASTVAILPVLAVFLIFQRYFVQGLATSGLKS